MIKHERKDINHREHGSTEREKNEGTEIYSSFGIFFSVYSIVSFFSLSLSLCVCVFFVINLLSFFWLVFEIIRIGKEVFYGELTS